MLEIVRIGESFPLHKNDISTIYRALASFKNSILTSLLAFGDTGSSGLSSHVDEETTAAVFSQLLCQLDPCGESPHCIEVYKKCL